VLGTAQILLHPTPLAGRPLLFCPKGPWLPWDDPWPLAHFFAGLEQRARRLGAFLLRMEPEVTEDNALARAHLRDFAVSRAPWELQYKTSWIVDLRPDEDALLREMKPTHRRNINKGARNGIVVVEDNAPATRARFYELLRETAQRDGFPLRTRAYLWAAWETMLAAGHAHLFLARSRSSEDLAGLMVYTLGAKMWYQYGASRTEGRNLMPAPLLQWEVMRWGKQHGITSYDMLAVPSPPHLDESHPWWGLYRFKSGFGGHLLDTVGTSDLPYRPRLSRLWRRVEPPYRRWHIWSHGNDYY
jgi:lipid II:glycine glycyltransferase (peptidoglycan interpeptide bridge formation enzyme)